MELRPKLSWDQLVHRHIICLFLHFLMFNWNKHVYEYHCSRKAILSNKLANKKQWHNDKKKIHLPMQELQEMQVQSLSREDPQEEEMVTCSSILAWKIPRPEETSGLQSLGL